MKMSEYSALIDPLYRHEKFEKVTGLKLSVRPTLGIQKTILAHGNYWFGIMLHVDHGCYVSLDGNGKMNIVLPKILHPSVRSQYPFWNATFKYRKHPQSVREVIMPLIDDIPDGWYVESNGHIFANAI